MSGNVGELLEESPGPAIDVLKECRIESVASEVVNNVIPDYCTNFLRATKNVTLLPWENFKEIQCQLSHDIGAGQTGVFSESLTLQKKGLFIRPALFQQNEDSSVFAINTNHRVFKISKGQRVGTYLILQQLV